MAFRNSLGNIVKQTQIFKLLKWLFLVLFYYISILKIPLLESHCRYELIVWLNKNRDSSKLGCSCGSTASQNKNSQKYANFEVSDEVIYCVKSVPIRSFSGPYFPTLGLNTEIQYSVRMREYMDKKNSDSDTFHVVISNHFWCKL